MCFLTAEVQIRKVLVMFKCKLTRDSCPNTNWQNLPNQRNSVSGQYCMQLNVWLILQIAECIGNTKCLTNESGLKCIIQLGGRVYI